MLTSRSFTYILVRCDVCKKTEHRSHEAEQGARDMRAFLEGEERRVRLPSGWLSFRPRLDRGDVRHVCPECALDIHEARP